MGIEGIMVRSFAQFGVVQTDYDMTRLLTENALLRQPGGIQEAAPISPDILTPEGRESYAQIALLVRQAARRLREEQERTHRQEAAEQARAEREEERRQEERQEQWRERWADARMPQEATPAMTRSDAAQEAAGQADTPSGQDGGTSDGRTPDTEDVLPLPAERAHGDRQSRSASRTEQITGRTAEQAGQTRTVRQTAGHAAGQATGQASDLMAAQTDAAAAGRTGSPTLLHLTV